jgi:arabinogalactan endo-1,4-beta-galactosidase
MSKRFLLSLSLFSLFCWSLFTSCNKEPVVTDPDPKDTVKIVPDSLFRGADVSWLTEMEQSGKKFYNAAGTQTECMALLKSLGMNSIRLRVWVNPSDGWCNTADLLVKAKRANDLGMNILIDFHYSDSWADPSKQTKPAAWSTYSFVNLLNAVTEHTTAVLTTLKDNGITPKWVQVGNETGDGMLWPEGKASVYMDNYARLSNAGYYAVKAVFPNTKVMIHINNGWNNTLFRWIFDGLKTQGAKWDVIGMSLYPTNLNWSDLNSQCLSNMNDMVNLYGSEIMLCEVGMDWRYPDACKLFLTDLIGKVKSVRNKKGIGVFYWEPECYGGWKGYGLGAFDNAGKPTVALDAFKH